MKTGKHGKHHGQGAPEVYGRAWKFVRRAFDTLANVRAFYLPTPAQAILRVIDHLQRVDAIAPRFLSDEHREAANNALYAILLQLQELDSGGSSPDYTPEVASGTAAGVYYRGRLASEGVAQQGQAPDFLDDGGNRRRALGQEHDVPAHFRDPAEVLSRYKMGQRRDRPLFSPAEEKRFVLNGQHHMMDWLRREESRLGLNRA